MLLHDGPLKRALVICYGVGVTVGAVTHIPSVESIDVAEISRRRRRDERRDLSRRAPGRWTIRASACTSRTADSSCRPRVERFDLITGEPPPPRTPGTVNIYTREYFQLVHDRLTDGGMATYWVPVARPHPGTDVNTIVRAFCDVFSDCSLWNATPFDLMLVGIARRDRSADCSSSSRRRGRRRGSRRGCARSASSGPSRLAPRSSATPPYLQRADRVRRRR